VDLPIGTGTGPWEVDVRVQSQTDAAERASLTVARPAAGSLLGDPTAYRAAAAAAAPFHPLAGFQFRRTERVRVDWPVLAPIDSHDVRLLDRLGGPSPVPVAVSRSADGSTVSATLNLAPLTNGDYLIEIVARAGETTDRRLLALRVFLAR
jgi:hypothetical protein